MASILFSRDVMDWRGPGGDGVLAILSVVVLRISVKVDVSFHI